MKTNKNKLTMTLLSCAALAAFTSSLRAATSLLDSTNDGANSYTSFTSYGSLAFSTGDQGYSLRSIEFAAGQAFNEDTASVTFSLFSGLTPSGSPIASQTFTNIVFASFFNANNQYLYEKNLSDGFTVNPNSNYSLVFSYSGNTGGGLLAANGLDMSGGTSGLTYLGRSYSPDSGASWNGPYYNVTPYLKLTDTAISSPPAGGGTSAVPEASTSLGLLALGAGGLLTRRRLKRKA